MELRTLSETILGTELVAWELKRDMVGGRVRHLRFANGGELILAHPGRLILTGLQTNSVTIAERLGLEMRLEFSDGTIIAGTVLDPSAIILPENKELPPCPEP